MSWQQALENFKFFWFFKHLLVTKQQQSIAKIILLKPMMRSKTHYIFIWWKRSQIKDKKSQRSLPESHHLDIRGHKHIHTGLHEERLLQLLQFGQDVFPISELAQCGNMWSDPEHQQFLLDWLGYVNHLLHNIIGILVFHHCVQGTRIPAKITTNMFMTVAITNLNNQTVNQSCKLKTGYSKCKFSLLVLNPIFIIS